MSDDEHSDVTVTDEPNDAAASDGGTDKQPPDSDEDRPGGRDVKRYIRYGLLVGLTLLALVALLRFYFAASNSINTWVTDEYRSLFQAAFNLVVLLVAAIGISWQVRQLA